MPMAEDRYNRTVFLYLDDAPVLANSYTPAKEDGQSGAIVTKTGFCAESGEVPPGIHLRIYTPGLDVQHQI